ncbi:hypothetical protein WJU23_02895 [Prosthecobacter sp. SYSU 5D2]|uniref:hypothetical protein n=1 Tax=Prosthecobacter sp. SYSU 5D2 TaxID=3134134 RepID=UPI0031FE4C85
MPEILPVLAENTHLIAEFCSSFPGDGRSTEFWIHRLNHWWKNNPAMTEDWPRGSMLMAEGSVQGICLCIPIRLVVDGKVQLAALRSTWRVLPAYRSVSLQLPMALDARISHLININGTPNATAVKIMKMFSHYWTCLRPEVMSSIHWGSPLAALCRMLRFSIPHKRLPRFVASNKITHETAAEQVDRHWVNIQSASLNGPVRDWNYWAWFSINNPSFSCSLFYHPLVINGAVFPLCVLMTDFGDGRLQLSDVWPHDATVNHLREMVNLIIKTARRHGFHSIQIAHLTPNLAQAAGRTGRFKTLSQQADIWVHQPSNASALNRGHWPLYNGDALL